MSRIKQITNSIRQGVSFSFGFGGIRPPTDMGELHIICDTEDTAKIGYHTQVFLARALYFDDLRINYLVEGDQVKIYY